MERDVLPFSFVSRFDTLRRDVRMVVNDLVGVRPPPFTVRAPLARHMLAATNSRNALAPRTLKVARVTRETNDAISLHLVDPEGRRFQFTPGQFFTVLVPIPGGEVLRRAYSISSLPNEDGSAEEVTITIKRLQGGRASNQLHDTIQAGQTIEVFGPSGSFTAGEPKERHLVLFAGGSGITPLMSITRTELAHTSGGRVSLVYGNRGEGDIIFRQSLAELAEKYPDRFSLRHVLSEPPAGFSGRTGILDVGTTLAEIDALGQLDAEQTDYFICGPEPMMAAVREALLSRGVVPARIHEERFSAPARRKTPDAPKIALPIGIRVGKQEREAIVSPGQTILEAGLGASLQMPFSCSMGGCGACKVKLVRGEVASEEPNCLSEEERKEGLVLACVSRPLTPVVVEVP